MKVEVYGRVQGVGYRFFVERAAQERYLSGWVANAPNGSVKIEAQGPEEDLRTLLRDLERGPGLAVVEKMKIDWLDSLPKEEGFYVKSI
ncbi:acylphosphatase [bacterium]|nr:acylphosphatase [bacterium]